MSVASASSPDRDEKRARKDATVAVTVFPLIIIAAFAVGYLRPTLISPAASYVPIALGIIMFGMGLTLTLEDFVFVAKHPLPVLIGVVAQFVIMPTIAIVLTTVLRLDPALAVGVILVGCAPGGTSSNVISYLARGDVALSVAMTTVSTLLSPIFTPLLTLWLAGEYVPVSAASMAVSIVKLVLVPVVAGVVLHMLFPRLIQAVNAVLPWVSVCGIAFVAAAIVSKSADRLVQAGLLVLLAVVIHNGAGYLLGYWTARLSGQPKVSQRTTAIEVGMQNSGLAATLAAQYFSPVTALPAAVFSIWHNISGAFVAMYFRRKTASGAK